MMRKYVACLCCVLLFTGMAACGGEVQEEKSSTEETERTDLIRIGYAQCGSESAWREANTASIQEYCTTENGIELDFQNAEGDIDKQIEIVKGFIQDKVDVIGLAPVVESGWDEVLEEARTAGIPVILVDRTLDVTDESLYECWIGSDFLLEGYKAADWVMNYLEENDPKDTYNVAVLEGTEGAGATIGRTQGVEEMFAETDKYHIIFSECGDFTYDGGKKWMEEYLNSGQQIDLLISQNDDMTLGAIDVMKEHGLEPGKDIVIVSFDGVHDAFEAMVQGEINCDVECNPLSGKAFADTAKKVMNGERVQKKVYVQEGIYDLDTASDYIDSRKY